MTQGFRVVLIDDDPDLRILISLTLKSLAGWEVSAFPDGPSGIEGVRQVMPDAVLLDVMMPGMDGYEVCRRLKDDATTAAIPVVLLTARREVDTERGSSVGAAGVLLKPFDPASLADQIRTTCGKTPDE